MSRHLTFGKNNLVDSLEAQILSLELRVAALEAFDFAADLYEPTLTAVLNVDTASMNSTFASYFRAGDIVFVFLTMYVNPTATGATTVDISLPIAADFAGGTARANGVMGSNNDEIGRIEANITDDRLTCKFVAANTTEHTLTVAASYRLA